MSLVTKDVPAYMTVAGNQRAVGLNLEGIKRRNISDEARGARSRRTDWFCTAD